MTADPRCYADMGNANADPAIPKPDRINPAAPPEQPIPPSPPEGPPGQPQEVPHAPGGDDIDQPGRGPDEVPPQREV